MAEAVQAGATALTSKDFQTDQEVRWCPGCGDYGVVQAIYRALAAVGRARLRSTRGPAWSGPRPAEKTRASQSA